MPQPIMRPMPRLELMAWPSATSHRPMLEPPVTMASCSSAPPIQATMANAPTKKPTARNMGLR